MTACSCRPCVALRQAPKDAHKLQWFFAGLPQGTRQLLAAMERVRAGDGSPRDVRRIQRAAEQCSDSDAPWSHP